MRICIKIGGALVREGIEPVIADIDALRADHQFVIVHGGGPQITGLSERLGIEPKYITSPSGYKSRHTDAEAIKVATLALAGEVNKQIVEALMRRGIRAFGCTGYDGGMLTAERKEKIMTVTPEGRRFIIRDEFSGKIVAAEGKWVRFLLDQDTIPVVGSLAASEKGEILNTDGDRAAARLASAVSADLLVSLTDVPGIYRDLETKEVIKTLDVSAAEALLEKLTGGMKKKLYASLEGLKLGLPAVVIGNGTREAPITTLLAGEAGTTVKR